MTLQYPLLSRKWAFKAGLAVMLALMPNYAIAGKIKDTDAIKAIIGEAENQGKQGMLAVACGIRNRGTLKGVYGLNAPRVKQGKYNGKTLVDATDAWLISGNLDNCAFLKGAEHWENINAFGKPAWACKMIATYEYKDHIFYKEEEAVR